MAYYEEEQNFGPVFRTALSLVQMRGNYKLCQLIQQAEINVINTDFDNWNGGTYGYTVFMNLPVRVYATLSKESIEEAEKVFVESLNEVTKGDDHHYFSVQIAPVFTTSDINWEVIGGETGKEQLKKDLEALKDLMISVATGGERIQTVDSRYKTLHNSINNRCRQLNIKYENNFASLWDWYAKWSNEFPRYQERRLFINQLLAPTFDAFDSDSTTPSLSTPIVELSDWNRINRTVLKIKQSSGLAKNEEDFQQIGLLCREVIISLAQAVYNPIVHGTKDEKGIEIGKTDAVRMIGNYINVRLAGSSNEELRAYARATNKLSNLLTHKRDAEKQDMLLSVSATIALINFIGILENKI